MNVFDQIQSLYSRMQTAFNGVQTSHRILEDPFSPGINQLSLTPKARKAFERVIKLMDSVCRACQEPRLCLKNSPPFILDILPDTYQHLIQIFKLDPEILRDNTYLRVFFENIHWKCKSILKLFHTGHIYNEKSDERRSLTKYSLIFSHMLAELKAEFPNAIFVGDKFRITKREAALFWEASFRNRTLVHVNEFIDELRKAHPIGDVQALALKETIDLTGDNYVSNFEFDVFTRLFYPWNSLLKNWQLLTNDHPGYVAFLTYDEVKIMLEKFTNRPGSFVFRLSCTRLGQWAIGYVAPDGKIYQTIPQNKSLIQALIEGGKEGFYLYPKGETKHIDLSIALETVPADRIKVTSDQYEIYCEMGTTFELCKICDDNEKNIKIEPCGHLLCQQCLTSWQDSSEGGNTCPFCRYEIKGTSKVIIESFAPMPGRRQTLSRKSTSTRLLAAPVSDSCGAVPEVKVRSASDSAAGPEVPVIETTSRRSYQNVCSLNTPQRLENTPSTSQRSSVLHRPSMGISMKLRRISHQSDDRLTITKDLDFSSQQSRSEPYIAPPVPPRRGTPEPENEFPIAPPPIPPKPQKPEGAVYVNVAQQPIQSTSSSAPGPSNSSQ